jgi:excisionase family DNA binding protein
MTAANRESPSSSQDAKPGTLPDRDFYTVRELANALQVDQGKVLIWIHEGELRALNVAESAKGRARWRIPREAWEAFAAKRSNGAPKPTPPPVRRRQRRDDHIIQFF